MQVTDNYLKTSRELLDECENAFVAVPLNELKMMLDELLVHRENIRCMRVVIEQLQIGRDNGTV